jgi:hypothetical protein
MNSNKLLVSLVPWVLFTIIAGHAGADFVGWAAATAAVVTVVIAVRGLRGRTVDGRRSSLKVIDVAGVVTFAVMAVLAFTGSQGLREHIVDYGRGACALILAVIMLGSLLAVPFTEQYAREQVPVAYWHSPVFRILNRRISAAFGLALLVMAASHFLSGWLESRGDLTAIRNLILNWAVPIVVILAAIKYTERLKGDRTPTQTPRMTPGQ